MSKDKELNIEKLLDEIRSTVDPQAFYEKMDRDTGKGIGLSFSEHGLDWCERVVRQSLPNAEIYSPMFASATYGNFFYEFDRWRSLRNMVELKSFQGVLVKSNGLHASCLRLSKRSSMTGWYGKKFEGKIISILCIDHLLIYLATSSLYMLIVHRFIDGIDSFKYLSEIWIKNLLNNDGTKFNNNVELTKKDFSNFFNAREKFLESSKTLSQYHWPVNSGNELAMYLGQSEGDDQINNQMYRYCESVIIHFLMGHEFGHYCFRCGKDRYFEEIRILVKDIVGDISKEIEEEVFCDIVAMENCLFQMEYFSIPQNITIYGTSWLLQFISSFLALYEKNQQQKETIEYEFNIRSRAISDYWRKRSGLKDHFILGNIAGTVNTVLPQLGKTLSYQMNFCLTKPCT